VRFFEIFIEVFYWVLIFLSPVLLFAVIALLLYIRGNLVLVFTSLIVGLVLGTILAEYIRRKYGCSNFISRLRN
jgi:hypothetical protein